MICDFSRFGFSFYFYPLELRAVEGLRCFDKGPDSFNGSYYFLTGCYLVFVAIFLIWLSRGFDLGAVVTGLDL